MADDPSRPVNDPTLAPPDGTDAPAARAPNHLARFLVVGVLATVVDAGTYTTMLWTGAAAVVWATHPHDVAKLVSFFFGTVVSYVLNKRYTFASRGTGYREPILFTVLYTITLALNVAVNHGLIQALGPAWAPVAFVAATATSTIVNFVGQKLWVFKDR